MKVPLLVTGDPVTEKMPGKANDTEVTVPEFVPLPPVLVICNAALASAAFVAVQKVSKFVERPSAVLAEEELEAVQSESKVVLKPRLERLTVSKSDHTTGLTEVNL